ncbi:Eco57I restriction-modification methylase domain-containing protein, partial [Patescibacteria group bacterium]|nr:Eco57I restriction-modification methylase domain-containing protein [Patescibacteria group bacterium]
ELSEQQSLFNDRILPVLSSNIKCGNSLIGTDYFAGQMMMDPAEMARINPFDWEPEFPEIFKRGGFDAVIGNPPYVLGRETFDEDTKDYFAKSYFVYGGKYDLYIYFTEKAISLLTASGKLGYIIPNTVLVNENAVKLRKVILDKTQIDIIRIFEERVFENAQVESVIVIASKKPTTSRPIIIESGRKVSYISQESFVNDRNFRFNVRLDPSTEKLITRITLQSNTLGNLSDICIGIQLGGSSGTDTKENFLSNTQIEKNYKKVLDGKDINSYEINWNNKFVRYGNWLHRKRDEKYFLNPKVMIRQIGAVPIATFDDQGFYTLNTIYNLISISDYSSKYFLAIINSKFGKWFWRTQNSDFKSLFPKIKKSQIENIPIRLVNFSDSTDRSLYDKVISFVDQILALNKQLSVAKSLSERVALQRQITATDRQIDQLVYKLYGLTEEEIKIVEEGTK